MALGALLHAFGEIARLLTRSIGDAVSPVIPVLSQTQQQILVTVGVVTGLALAAFVVIQAVLLLAPQRRGATVRLRQRHREPVPRLRRVISKRLSCTSTYDLTARLQDS
jgi:hypothetical protein